MTEQERGKRYILVVESNADDRFQASMLLQQLGYNIFLARTADEAIEFMTVAPPVGILSEAGVIGTTLLTRLGKDGRFSGIPVLLLTKTPDRALEDRARRGEFGALLRKPVKADELYRALQEVVEKGPRRNIRIATSLNARLDDAPGGSDEFVTVISEHGMFFRTLDPRPVKSRIPVSIEIKGRTIKVEAVVLYNTSFDEGPFKEPGMGMKFVKISPADQAGIKEHILQQLAMAEQG